MKLSQYEIDQAVQKSIVSLDEVVGGVTDESMYATNYYESVGVHNIKGGGIKKRIVRKSLAAPTALAKKLTQGYLQEQARVDNAILSLVSRQQADLEKIREELPKKLSADRTDTHKLIDGFKKEILAELVDLKGGTHVKREKTSPKIIHAERVRDLKKVNIGCGRDIRDDYINIDDREIEGVDVVADVLNLPFENGSLDEVFASHVAEHFTERDFKKVLAYWLDLVKDDGVVRLIVPNIEVMARRYAKGEITWDQLRSVILGGQDYASDHHFNQFSLESMEELVMIVAPKAKFEVIDGARRNGDCFEMEVVVRK